MKRLFLIPLLFLCSTLWAADDCISLKNCPFGYGDDHPSLAADKYVENKAIQLARMNPYILGAPTSAAAPACTISDNFSSDTHLNYYSVRQGNNNSLSISAGKAYPYDANTNELNLHDTVLSGNDHCVQADMTVIDADDRPWLVLRGNEQSTSATGYVAKVGENTVAFYKFSGYASMTSVSGLTVSWANSATHTLRICAVTNGETTDFHFYIDGVEDDQSPVSDASYMTGTYVGTGFDANGGNAYIDNFKANPTASGCMP